MSTSYICRYEKDNIKISFYVTLIGILCLSCIIYIVTTILIASEIITTDLSTFKYIEWNILYVLLLFLIPIIYIIVHKQCENSYQKK